MGRSISFGIPKWAQKQKTVTKERLSNENTEENQDEEEEIIGTASLGSGNAWPFYWRSMLIAGYRMVQAQDENHYPCERQLILDTILKICPVNCDHIDNSKVSCGQALHLLSNENPSRRNMQILIPGLGVFKQKVVDEAALFDANNRSILEMVGLGVITELASLHYRMDFSQDTIRRVATMLQMLEPYFVYEKKGLEGTPWQEMDYCLLEDQMEGVIEEFVKAAQLPFVVATFY